MEYKEVTYLERVGTYRTAIDLNDFDSMVIRLVMQLTPTQIANKVEQASQFCFGKDTHYIIASDEGFWSNDLGWAEDKESAERYTLSERMEIGYFPMASNVRWERAD